PAACTPKPPVRLLAHRLNHTEYNNAVRDLLGDTSNPADTLPPDANVYGFANYSTAQSFNSDLLAKMETAAVTLADAAVQRGVIGCDPAAMGEQACATQVLGT